MLAAHAIVFLTPFMVSLAAMAFHQQSFCGSAANN
jgi:hypothetical protein